jgi:arylsulfatase A-like enzyme
MAGGSPAELPFLDGHSLFHFFKQKAAGTVGQSQASTESYPLDRAVVSQYHSNMGNTGSFMIRKGPWKLITYGNDGVVIKGYKTQLFNIEKDPAELDDVASDPSNAATVTSLLAELTAVVDYEKVDASVKANDKALYKEYFVEKLNSDTKLRKAFEKAYTGFDDADWGKIQLWFNATNY